MSTSKLKVLYEDNHLLAVDKPAGMAVQPDASGDRPLIDLAKKYLIEKYDKPGDAYVGLPHRLDRPVSGVVLLTKTSKALERVVKQFRERQVEKYYLAVVDGLPDPLQGKLSDLLRKDRRKNKSFVMGTKKDKATKRAETLYLTVGQWKGRSLLLLKLLTGRHHQIRAQAAHMGTPIVGDLKYGGPKHDNPRSILLHSFRLVINHPTLKKPVTISSLPAAESDWNGFSNILVKEALEGHFDKFEYIE